MESFEREFFVYRILSSYIKYKSNSLELKIIKPSVDTIYESQCLYMEVYQESLENNCLSAEEILSMMVSKELWTDEDTNQLDVVLPKHLDFWKVELYNNYTNKVQVGQIRGYLETVKSSLQDLFKRRHLFDHYTQHGLATFARWQYIIENTTVNYDGSKHDFKNININTILEAVNKSQLSETVIRELSRTEPWRSMWSAGKKSGLLFSSAVTDLSDEQRRLINWSTLYDNINEYDDCPSEEIINDDDALDGWMIIKNKENKKAKEKAAIEKRVKRGEDGETFIVAESKEEAAKIYEMNSPTARMIVQQRLNDIRKSDKELVDTDFADIQRGLNRGTGQIIRTRR